MGRPLEQLTLSTSLSGRLRNTHLPKSRGLFPLFEAVVNSIQSIDSTYADANKGHIQVHIVRHGQAALAVPVPGRVLQEPITEFRVRDNGAGFDSTNMNSFKTLDSEYKLNEGGRGIGRLLWLKAFRRVEITSVYREGHQLRNRRFRFTEQDGVIDHEVEDTGEDSTFAQISLVGFDKKYQQGSRKRGLTIARDLLEHCLWYFVRLGGAPNITVHDDDEVFNLDNLYEEHMRSSSEVASLAVKGTRFEVIHLKLKAGAKAAPSLSWCAGNRVVIEENISGRVAGLHGPLTDSDGEFIYAGYLTSAFLDEHVRPERTEFDLQETAARSGDEPVDALDGLFEEELSRAEIRDAALRTVECFLNDSLTVAREKSRDKVEAFVRNKAPRYRPVLRRIIERGPTLDPNLGEQALELELHKRFTEFEAEVLREGQQVLDRAVLDLSDEEYAKKLDEYLAKVEDVKKSDLAAYVSKRRLILDLLAQAIERQPDGKYSREDRIHGLIMPMRTTSDDDAHRASNLWMIDERLAFHNYLASDKPLNSMPITGSESAKRPDLLALQLCDVPILITGERQPPWTSLSIVEVKRPMRNDATAGEEKDPIEQCLKYLDRIRKGRVTTAQGRPIPGGDSIPGFCYIIADLTEALLERCRMFNLNMTADGLGYFGYQQKFDAYIEVISFDRLLNVANQRNRAFFDVIGFPAS